MSTGGTCVYQIPQRSNLSSSSTLKVKGYPTIKVVHKGEELMVYRGQRDLNSMYDYIVKTHEELTTESS